MESQPKSSPERLAELEEELARQLEINRALMSRVERSTDLSGNSFSLFESNIMLHQRVDERTRELQLINARLQEEVIEHKRTETELRTSQRQTRLIIDTALDAVIAFDRDWNILDWNPRAEVTFGYDAGFATDQLNLKSVISANGHEPLRNFLTERLTGSDMSAHALELSARHRDGRDIPVEIAVSVLNTGDNPIYSAFIRDITERKQIEEARYRTLFDNSPVSLREEDFSEVKRYIDKLNVQGITDLPRYFKEFPEALTHCLSLVRIIDVNLATTRLFRAKTKEQFQDRFTEIYRGNAVKLFLEELLAMAAGRSSFESEASLLTIDGNTVYVLVNLSVAPGHRESWSKVFISALDMTDRHLAEEEKDRLESQLRQTQKMDTIGTLAGGIAHDFNNMLTPIIGYADIIADSMNDERVVRDAVEHVISAATRARDLVRHILTFSRQVDNEPKPTRSGPLVKEALDLMRASLPSTVNLQVRIDPDARVILADATQIHQIILNLCTNAYHALHNGHGMIDVTLTNLDLTAAPTQQQTRLRAGQYVCLTVSDNGCGIKRENLDRIFEPFYTTKEVGKGTGMGLAVAHGIVRKHGGEITVESHEGRGSRFRVYLPAVDDEPVFVSPKATLQQGHEHILVVDDEPMVAQITSKMLQRLGYVVTTSTGATDALAIFGRSPQAFDAVVTDQTMPELSGNVLAMELHKLRADIPVILLTGFSHTVSEENVKSFGISEMLYKPVTAADLSHAVRRALDAVHRTV